MVQVPVAISLPISSHPQGLVSSEVPWGHTWVPKGAYLPLSWSHPLVQQGCSCHLWASWRVLGTCVSTAESWISPAWMRWNREKGAEATKACCVKDPSLC